jgi:hypothetical protein
LQLLIGCALILWLFPWNAPAQSRAEELSPLDSAAIADMHAIVSETIRPFSMQSLVDEVRKAVETKATGSQIMRNPGGGPVKKYGRDVVVQAVRVSASGQAMLQISNEAVCAEKECPILSYVQLREPEPGTHDKALPFGRVGIVLDDLQNAQSQSAPALFRRTRMAEKDVWAVTCVFRDGRWQRVAA